MSHRPKTSDQTWRDLIPASQEIAPLKGARRLPLALLDPNPEQARQVFDEAALAELAASIVAQGVIQPIVVRAVGDRYQVVAGERRTRAARLAALTEIPAIIREYTDEQAAVVTAIENLQREDLDIEDEARQLQALMTLTGLSGRALAERVGKNHRYVNRRLALLRYPDLLQAIRAGSLTQRDALDAASSRDSSGPAAPSNIMDRADVGHRDPLRSGDSEPDPTPDLTERATLDTRSAPGPAGRSLPSLEGLSGQEGPPRPERVIYPWRRRPLDQFAEWVARTPPTAVPPQERAVIQETVAEVRAWLERWERELRDLGHVEDSL